MIAELVVLGVIVVIEISAGVMAWRRHRRRRRGVFVSWRAMDRINHR